MAHLSRPTNRVLCVCHSVACRLARKLRFLLFLQVVLGYNGPGALAFTVIMAKTKTPKKTPKKKKAVKKIAVRIRIVPLEKVPIPDPEKK